MKRLAAVRHVVVAVAVRWYRGGVGDLAAGVTFWILVSLPAATLALLAALRPLERVASIGFQAEIEDDVRAFVARVFTAEASGVQDTVGALFDQRPNSGLLAVSILVAVWSVGRGFAGLMRALDDIYEIEHGRAWYHTRIVATLLGLGSLTVPVGLVVLDRLVWDRFPDGIFEDGARWVAGMAVLVAWASTLLHFGPSRRSAWRYDLPGAITAAVLWRLLSGGYGWYISLSSGANDVTAAVGASLLALTWIWLSAQVLLIGGTVNHVLGQRWGISRARRSIINDVITDVITGEIRKVVDGPPEPGGATRDRPGTRSTPR